MILKSVPSSEGYTPVYIEVVYIMVLMLGSIAALVEVDNFVDVIIISALPG
jgi:hypothetical protein